ncbi:MAG: DUF2059 domain-containing protein [Pseudomonadota bacterium]
MKNLKMFLAAVIVSFLPNSPAIADAKGDADYIAEQTVTVEMFNAILKAQREVIIAAIQQQLREKDIRLTDPDRFFDLFMSEFVGEFVDVMRSETANIYLEELSPEALGALGEFLRSDAGQEYLNATPRLLQEGARMGAKAGQSAGVNAGRRLATRIEAEGLVVTEGGMMETLMELLR